MKPEDIVTLEEDDNMYYVWLSDGVYHSKHLNYNEALKTAQEVCQKGRPDNGTSTKKSPRQKKRTRE